MTQTPAPESFLLKWRGDTLAVTLAVDPPRKGRAAFRTNLGHGDVRRREIVDETEKGLTPLAKAWTDIPLAETAPGVFAGEIPLDEVGVFSGKACFFPEGSHVPEWPEGRNLHVKVESAETRACNSIYCVFPRLFMTERGIAIGYHSGTGCSVLPIVIAPYDVILAIRNPLALLPRRGADTQLLNRFYFATSFELTFHGTCRIWRCAGNFAMSVSHMPLMASCLTNTGMSRDMACATMFSTHSILQGRRFGPLSHPTTIHLKGRSSGAM